MIVRILIFLIFIAGSCHLQAQNTLIRLNDDYHYRLGLELMDKEQYGAAREAFETYLKNPANDLNRPDAEYYAAFSALRLYHADGEKLLRDFVERYENHPKARVAYYELGNFYFKEKNYRRAIKYFEEADLKALKPAQRAEAQFKTAYSYFGFKEFDKALPFFNQVKNGNNDYTHAASYYAGYIEFNNGDYRQALEDLQRAGAHESYAAVIPYMIANIYNRQGRHDELIAYAENALEKEEVKNKEEIMALAGDAWFSKGNYRKAVEYLGGFAEKQRSAPPETYYKLGYANYRLGAYTAAVENLKQAALAPDTVGQYASYYLGASYLKEDNKIFASTAFERAMNAPFDNQIKREAAFYYGKVNYDQGKYAEAIAALKDFTSSYPGHPYAREANDLIGQAYLRTTNYDLALEHIESLSVKSDKIKRIYQKVTYYKGVELFNNSRYYQAVQLFEKSLAHPYDKEIVAQAHFWMGEAYSIGEKYDEAINSYAGVFRNSSESDQTFLKARYGIGYAYYNSRQYEKALPHFREYTARLERGAPKMFYNDALIRLGDCYYAVKDYQSAIRAFDKAIDAGVPETDYAYYQKGVALGVMGSAAEAKASLKKLLNQYPSSRYRDQAMFEMGQIDLENGAYQQAVESFTQLINNSRQGALRPYGYLRRALAHFNLQNYEQSASDYKTIIINYPAHEIANSALLGLQEALNIQGEAEEFEEYLARYKSANPDNKSLKSIEFESAKNLYFSQKYDRAIAAFTDYIKSYPDSESIDEAHYFIGDSYFRQEQRSQALEYFYLVAEKETSGYYNRSISRIAELEYLLGNHNTAIAYNKKLLQTAGNKKEEYYGWSGLMKSYFMIEEYDSVNHYARLILEKGIVSANAQNEARLYLGKAAYEQEQYDEAVDHFVNALNTAKDEHGAEAQYLMAEAFFRQGDYKQSIQTLYDLNQKFSIYEKWLGKSFLLIAENYLALGELFQAKATLNSLIEKSPLESIRNEAKTKLQEVEEQERLQQPQQDTSIFQDAGAGTLN